MIEAVPQLSMVIPVYNEQDNVEILYREIRTSVDQLEIPYEIIFVDDGSSDSTVARLKLIKKTEEEANKGLCKLRIIQFSRNFGQTAAMQAGFDHAMGEFIVSLDGDLQNDPKDIPKLLNKLQEGYDLVCGWRKDRKDKALTRTLPSKVANMMIRRFIGVTIHDIGCSLKTYRGPMIKSVKLYSDMHRFIPVLSTLKDARISEMVVNHRSRRFGKPKYGLSRTWKVLFDLISIKMLKEFRHRPIAWFGIFGIIFCFLGLVLGTAAILLFIDEEQSIVFIAASIISFFVSGNLLSWGLLAEFFLKIEKSRMSPNIRT